jgi:hypothetical protein
MKNIQKRQDMKIFPEKYKTQKARRHHFIPFFEDLSGNGAIIP